MTRKQRILLNEKYYPIVANLNILLLLGLSILGYDLRNITGYFVGIVFVCSIHYWECSIEHHFCNWNRFLLSNTFLYGTLHLLEKFGCLPDFAINFDILGIHLKFTLFIALILTIVCIIVATILYFRNGCFNTKSSSRIKETNN